MADDPETEAVAEPETEPSPLRPAFTYPVPDDVIRRLAPAALRTYRRLVDLLGLSQFEQRTLLGLAAGEDMPTSEEITEEQFYRLSYVFGIWMDKSALRGEEGAIKWFNTPYDSEEMAGRTPVGYMIDQGLPGFDYLRREAAYWAHNGW